MSKIDQYLEAMLKSNASDLHFVSGDPIRARVHGELKVLVNDPLTPELAQEALFEIMDATTQRTFEKEEAADFAYEIEGVSRFRANAFRHLNGIGGSMIDDVCNGCAYTWGGEFTTSAGAQVIEGYDLQMDGIFEIEAAVPVEESSWGSLNSSDQIRELQDTNRRMTNEKNKYLTRFESLQALLQQFRHPPVKAAAAVVGGDVQLRNFRALVEKVQALGAAGTGEYLGVAEVTGDALEAGEPGMMFSYAAASLLIMVGVGLDTVKQIESQLMMRNYEGFIR